MPKTSRRQPALAFGAASAPAISRHEFLIEGLAVAYAVKRSARRRAITLSIDADGLRVGAPWRASQRHIETLLAGHAQWIKRKLAEWRARRPPPQAWCSGARIMVLGEAVTLVCDPGQAAVAHAADKLLLPLHPWVDPATLQARVVAWLRTVALACFQQRAAYYAPVLAVDMPAIRLSNARTRWGTCHADGRVHLSWRLIQMPTALLDYVVVHELAHLREPNHSRRFWHTVERVLPDYAERRRALRRDGYRYLVT